MGIRWGGPGDPTSRVHRGRRRPAPAVHAGYPTGLSLAAVLGLVADDQLHVLLTTIGVLP